MFYLEFQLSDKRNAMTDSLTMLFEHMYVYNVKLEIFNATLHT